ncbi:hypothetical protein [Dulcicalothrix desertica]|uniref:hypothetical protein n=1 Tax=Dulcicalothrix desertica TaxID=32056 RepID=UPI000F8CF17C|nr:hypothetical protein [Dulcicalothrix desertica]
MKIGRHSHPALLTGANSKLKLVSLILDTKRIILLRRYIGACNFPHLQAREILFNSIFKNDVPEKASVVFCLIHTLSLYTVISN